MGATAPKQVSQSWTEVNSEPLIYMTFGTVAGRSRKSRLACRAALEAVSALPVRALLSTGRAMNVEELGAIPKNVTVQSWVNPEEVCAHANAIVCHGGSGTVLSGLAAGLPMVIAPLFLNQPNNARSVDAAGAGIAVFDPDSWTLRSAMERVLSDGAMRLAARRIAAEIAEMPSVDDAVDVMLALT